MRYIITVLGFVSGFSIITLGCWLGGFDFNERGDVMVMWYSWSVIFGMIGALVVEVLIRTIRNKS